MIQIDMPMPDNCLECRFNTSEFGYCNAMPVEFVGQVSDCEEDGKPEWCPLKAQGVATVEPKRIELADETKAWLNKMDAVDALNNIADICIDWDGYRTADGLGGLINEIWAYARYCADRLLKAQEPRVMTLDEVKSAWRNRDIAFLVEYNDGGYPVWMLYYGYLSGLGEILLIDEIAHIRHFGVDGYGVGWRCWTSRPTDDQREATPWE